MSKTKTEPKIYTEWELNELAEKTVTAAHNALVMEERRLGKRAFETFGEWKALNPNNPVAKMNYPDDEYVMVINTYKTYFDKMCAAAPLDDDDELI